MRLSRLICLGLVIDLALFPALVWANPQGGVVATGQAAISASGSKTTINQSTNKAVIDWRSFNIGTGETTQFVQPGAGSVALNRIHDQDGSKIMGNLTA